MVLIILISINSVNKFFYTTIKFLLKGLFLLFAFFQVANASNLSLQLNGELPKHVEKNIRAYLGELPETELERSAFIYSAKDNTIKALQSLGYYRADIETVSKKDPWQLILSVTLNEPTLLSSVSIIIEGEAKDDAAFIPLLQEHNLHQGDILHHGKYEEVKSNILSLALQRGYFNGTLLKGNITIIQGYETAKITILYDSGPRHKFGKVTFSDFDLDPALMSSLVPFNENDYYSAKKFHRFQSQLQATQYFGSVLTIPEEPIQDKVSGQYHIPIKAIITPAKSHQFDFGIGYATDTQFRSSIGWRTPLINKYGHYQETKFEYSPINPTGKFIYSIPLKHPTNDVLQLKLTVQGKDYADIKTKFYSAQVGKVSSNVNWNREAYLRYHRESWSYNLNNSTPNIIWSEKDYAEYYIPGVTWSKTIREGSALDPSAGFRQTYNIETAHLSAGSDNSFFRVHGRWNYITTLRPKHRLVTRGELGAIYIDKDAQLAPSLRFYAGGDQSIRGFAYQSIGPTVNASDDPDNTQDIVVGGTRLIVGSVEYQYYVNKEWRLALFSDGGSVTNADEFNPVYSFGSGAHYISPVGAVKMDVAYGINGEKKGWHVHINLGAEL